MNATNSTIFANKTTNKATDVINHISEIVGYYVIPVVSLIGILLNIFSTFILRKKELKHYSYKYLWVKAIIDLTICILGLGYNYSLCLGCDSTNSNTYELLFYQWYVININTRVILAVSSLHEIYMITERYYAIKGEKKWFLNIKLKFYVPSIFLIPVLVSILIFMAIEIKPEENGDLYYWTLSEYGESMFFKILSSIIILPESLLLVMILTIMNILTTKAFIEYSRKKATLKNQNKRVKDKQKIQFTRMMIILTILYIVTALFDDATAMLTRITIYLDIEFSSHTIALFNCARQLSLLMIFASHSFDVFIYVPMDQNLSRLIRRTFSRNRQ